MSVTVVPEIERFIEKYYVSGGDTAPCRDD